MRVLVLSDLHIEFEDFHTDTSNVDAVILAGDIHVKEKGFRWAFENIKEIPVLYVLGNHEFYGKAYPRLIHKLKKMAQDCHVHIMENDVININNINFLGCTLWTDFSLLGDPRLSGYECQQAMTDFKKIRIEPRYSKLRSIDVSVIHRKSVQWLDKALERLKGQTNVVVTHHAPSKTSIPDELKEDVISSAYASNLEHLIHKHQPAYWIHGHLHNSSNYTIGNTRILCNPRGYKGERNCDFNEHLTVDFIPN